MSRKSLTQKTEWNCGLCPDDNFASFETAHEIRVHANDEHGVPLDQTQRMKRQAVMFLDGAHGSAQQVHNWILEDGRIFATMVWSSGVFAGQKFGKRGSHAD